MLTSDLRHPGVADPADERRAPVPVRRDLRGVVPRRRRSTRRVPSSACGWSGRASARCAPRSTEVQPDVVFVWQMGALSLGLLTTVARQRPPDRLRGVRRLAQLRARARRLEPRVPPVAPSAGPGRRWPAAACPPWCPTSGPPGTFCFISETTRRRAEELAPVHDARQRDRLLRHRRPSVHAGRPAPLGRLDGPAPLRRPLRPPQGDRDRDPRPAHGSPQATLEVQGTGDPGERDRLARARPRPGGRRPRASSAPSTGPRSSSATAPRTRSSSPASGRSPSASCPWRRWPAARPSSPPASAVPGSSCSTASTACASGPATRPRWPRRSQRLAGGRRRCATRLVRHGRTTAAAFDVERLTDCFEAWLAGAATGFPAGRPPSRRFRVEGDACRRLTSGSGSCPGTRPRSSIAASPPCRPRSVTCRPRSSSSTTPPPTTASRSRPATGSTWS